MKLLTGIFLLLLFPAAAGAASNTKFNEDNCANTREMSHQVSNWGSWLDHLRDDKTPTRKTRKTKRRRPENSRGRR